jgi:hypothetical protein
VTIFRIHWCLRFVSFLFLQTQVAALQPSIELGTECVDRAALVVDVAMNGHTLTLFPALNCAHVPFNVSGNFLPGIEGGFRGPVGRSLR